MKHYETIVIVDPDLSEEERTPLLDRFEETLTQMGGTLIQMDHWGMKKLAYEIKKKPRGYYLRMDYGGAGSVVDEIERFCRIDDRVLKYMTVLQAESVDAEKLKAELAQAEAEKAPEAAPEAQEEPEVTPEAQQAPEETQQTPEATPEAQQTPEATPEAPQAEETTSEAGPTESTESEATQTESDETKREESE